MKAYFKDKRILITGGTSGLGLALARQLTDFGAKVAVVARNTPANPPIGVHHIQGDIANVEQAHRIFAEAISAIGPVDIFINSASSLGVTPLRLLLDTDCETFLDVLQTNLLGAFRLIKLVLPAMILNGSGTVVNISSDAAIQAYPRWGAYAVSKAALDHLSAIFQAELQDTGVRFLAIDPGDMDTPLHLAAVPDADRSKLRSPSDSANALLEQISMTEQAQGVRRSLV